MKYSRYWFPLAAALAWSLGGCAHNTVIKCPALRQYTSEFNDALADELDAAGRPPHVETAIADYIQLRDQCKAAIK